MKIYGCGRHGAVLGPCSRCYEIEQRERTIAACKHVRTEYLATEWRNFWINGLETMRQEFGVILCGDCPIEVYTTIEEPAI